MNIQFQCKLSYDDRLSVLCEMCHRMGLSVFGLRSSFLYYSEDPIVVMKMLDHDVNPIIDQAQCCDSHLRFTNAFDRFHFEIDPNDPNFLIDIFRIRAFEVEGSRLRLSNMFFAHYEIMQATSKEEAFILIDLVDDGSFDVKSIHNKFIESFKTYHSCNRRRLLK